MTDAYKQDQTPVISQTAHILFHIKYIDPCPTVPIEAISCCVPAIGSFSGDMPELVPDEVRRLLEMPDSWVKICYPALDEMIEAVIKNMGDLNSRCQKTCKRSVSHFSKDHWLEQCRQIFTEVL